MSAWYDYDITRLRSRYDKHFLQKQFYKRKVQGAKVAYMSLYLEHVCRT